MGIGYGISYWKLLEAQVQEKNQIKMKIFSSWMNRFSFSDYMFKKNKNTKKLFLQIWFLFGLLLLFLFVCVCSFGRLVGRSVVLLHSFDSLNSLTLRLVLYYFCKWGTRKKKTKNNTHVQYINNNSCVWLCCLSIEPNTKWNDLRADIRKKKYWNNNNNNNEPNAKMPKRRERARKKYYDTDYFASISNRNAKCRNLLNCCIRTSTSTSTKPFPRWILFSSHSLIWYRNFFFFVSFFNSDFV